MHLKNSLTLSVVLSTSSLMTGNVFASAKSMSRSPSTQDFILNEGVVSRSGSQFENQDGSNHSIRKLVKKMLTRRTQMDICDKGTGRCK